MSRGPFVSLLRRLGYRLVGRDASARAPDDRDQLVAALAHMRSKVLKLRSQLESERSALSAARGALATSESSTAAVRPGRIARRPAAGTDPSPGESLASSPDTQGRSYLVCSRKDGLGARLSNVLWSWRLARKAGARLFVFWPAMSPRYDSEQRSSEIFDSASLATGPLRDEIQIVDGSPEDLGPIDYVTYLAPDGFHDPRRFEVALPAAEAREGPIPVLSLMHGPVLTPGESAEEARREVRGLFESLPFHRSVVAAVDEAGARRDLSRTVAVHVRQGDITKMLRGSCTEFVGPNEHLRVRFDMYTGHFLRCCAPAGAYARALEPLLGQGFDILFFTDTPGTWPDFRRRYKGRITRAAKLAPPGLSAMQTALLELLLMSRCRAVVGARSMFASLAGLVGGAEFVDVRLASDQEQLVRHYLETIDLPSLGPDAAGFVTRVLSTRLKDSPVLDPASRLGFQQVKRLVEAAAQAGPGASATARVSVSASLGSPS